MLVGEWCGRWGVGLLMGEWCGRRGEGLLGVSGVVDRWCVCWWVSGVVDGEWCVRGE